jgi:hypothetical protein|tara:strand:- start:6978 stop:7340 length:363 start_codon:yes stop_codon:yes gene_type:complete
LKKYVTTRNLKYNKFMTTNNYKPLAGQLCQVFKGFDNTYPMRNDIDCLVTDPLVQGELVMITKVTYNEKFSNYYVEFMRSGQLYYCYFHEQVMFFEMEGYSVCKRKEPIATFNFPWVLCE